MHEMTIGGADSAATMTSLELVEFINEERKFLAESEGAEFPSKGFAKLEHSDFLKKVHDVLGERAGNFSATYKIPGPNNSSRSAPCYRFPKREACLMAMSYSYELQAKVFDRMTELEKSKSLAIPDFSDPILAARAWADAKEAERNALLIANEAIRTKAEIGHRREATAMNTASQAVKKANKLEIALDESLQWSTIRRMEKRYPGMAFSWRILSNASQEVGIPPQKIPDKLFDQVNTYHAEAWASAYNLDINE